MHWPCTATFSWVWVLIATPGGSRGRVPSRAPPVCGAPGRTLRILIAFVLHACASCLLMSVCLVVVVRFYLLIRFSRLAFGKLYVFGFRNVRMCWNSFFGISRGALSAVFANRRSRGLKYGRFVYSALFCEKIKFVKIDVESRNKFSAKNAKLRKKLD